MAVAVGRNHRHMRLRNFLFPSPNRDKPPNGEMSDDDEIQSDNKIQSHLTNGGPSYFAMDEAFRVQMLKAIAAGLENAQIGVVTTPGTKNPKYVPTERWALSSSSGDF
jgi:hypothetical protein